MIWVFLAVLAAFVAGSAFFAAISYLTLLRCMRSPAKRSDP